MVKGWLDLQRRWLLLGLCAWLVGCGQSAEQTPASSGPTTLPSAGLPPLPSPASPASAVRRISDTQAQVLGDASVADGGGNNYMDPVGHTWLTVCIPFPV
jgi:hypothetical protein